MPGPRPSVLKLFDPFGGPETPRRGSGELLELDDSSDKENTPKIAGVVTTFFRRTYKSKSSQRSKTRIQHQRGGVLVDILDPLCAGTFGRLDGVSEECEEKGEADENDEKRAVSAANDSRKKSRGDSLVLNERSLKGLSESAAYEEETDDTISVPLVVEPELSQKFPAKTDSAVTNSSLTEVASSKLKPNHNNILNTLMVTLANGEGSQSLLSPSVSLSTATAYLQPSPLCTMIGTTPSPLTPSEPSLSPPQASVLAGSTGTVNMNMNKSLKIQGGQYDMSFDILNDDMSLLSGFADVSQDPPLFPTFSAPNTLPFQIDNDNDSFESKSASHDIGEDPFRVLKQKFAMEYEKKLAEMKIEEAKNDAIKLPEIRPLVLKSKQQAPKVTLKGPNETDEKTITLISANDLDIRHKNVTAPVLASSIISGPEPTPLSSSTTSQASDGSRSNSSSSTASTFSSRASSSQSAFRANTVVTKAADTKSKFKGIQRPSPGDRIISTHSSGLTFNAPNSQSTSGFPNSMCTATRSVSGVDNVMGRTHSNAMPVASSKVGKGPQRPNRPPVVILNGNEDFKTPLSGEVKCGNLNLQRPAINIANTKNGFESRILTSKGAVKGKALGRTQSTSSSIVASADNMSLDTQISKLNTARSAIPRPAGAIASRLPAPSRR